MKDYKKILKGVVNIIATTEKTDIGFANICSYLSDNCDELFESEDEKIKREIIKYIKTGTYHKDWIAWLEKQGASYTKEEVDDAYLKGINDAKNEIEKQHEANYQIRKDIATFIFNYRGDIKDRAKWMDYLGIKISFVEKQDNQKSQGKSALEAIKEEKKIDDANKVEPTFHEGDWSEDDEQILLGVIFELEANKSEAPEYDYKTYDKFIDWLESLKERCTWKPSEEQMNALDSTLQYSQVSHDSYEQLNSLYNDLKKLTK